MYDKERAILGKYYYLNDLKDSVQFDVLKFYVSKFSLYKDGVPVFTEKSSFHLLAIDENLQIKLPFKLDFDAISFNIGIDSATNVSGALGGDLDPENGMYWTWQSGYINFKIEGNSSVCKTRNHVFQWHIGGYKYPYATIQEIKLPCINSKEIIVGIDLKQMLEQSGLESIPVVMSPSIDAVRLSSKFKNCFSIIK